MGKIDEPQDMSLKFGGRVVEIRIFLNTDQDLVKLLRRVSHHAKGPDRHALIAMMNEYSGEDGRAIWAAIQEQAVEIAADPRATTMSTEEPH